MSKDLKISRSFAELSRTDLAYEEGYSSILEDYKNMATDLGLEYIGPVSVDYVRMRGGLSGVFVGTDQAGFISELWATSSPHPHQPVTRYYLIFKTGNGSEYPDKFEERGAA